ncbi:MAG: ureidoglycolate lyase [Paracoccaceae bacterium]
MTHSIKTEPLTAGAFAPFGDVLEAIGTPDKTINQGLCDRFHDRAKLDFGARGRAGISIFRSKSFSLPLELEMVERHPDGSQAFVPMSEHPFLVVVAPDERGTPGTLLAFLSAPSQAINIHRGIWHGVLTPLHAPGIFAVVDRIGDTGNLEEHWFQTRFVIES